MKMCEHCLLSLWLSLLAGDGGLGVYALVCDGGELLWWWPVARMAGGPSPSLSCRGSSRGPEALSWERLGGDRGGTGPLHEGTDRLELSSHESSPSFIPGGCA